MTWLWHHHNYINVICSYGQNLEEDLINKLICYSGIIYNSVSFYYCCYSVVYKLDIKNHGFSAFGHSWTLLDIVIHLLLIKFGNKRAHFLCSYCRVEMFFVAMHWCYCKMTGIWGVSVYFFLGWKLPNKCKILMMLMAQRLCWHGQFLFFFQRPSLPKTVRGPHTIMTVTALEGQEVYCTHCINGSHL